MQDILAASQGWALGEEATGRPIALVPTQVLPSYHKLAHESE